MHMVGCAVDNYWFSFLFFNKATKIGVKLGFYVRSDRSVTSLGAENDVKKKIGICVGHSYVAVFDGSGNCIPFYLRLATLSHTSGDVGYKYATAFGGSGIIVSIYPRLATWATSISPPSAVYCMRRYRSVSFFSVLFRFCSVFRGKKGLCHGMHRTKTQNTDPQTISIQMA